jgi:ribosomal protein S18 acetylase RimI-like enzyme
MQPKIVSPISVIFKSGIIFAPFRFGCSGFARIKKTSQCVLEMKKKSTKGPCWQLMAIGVDSASRRSGIGQKLMSHVFTEIDRQNKHFFLETANKDSIIFFKKVGFRIVQEKQIKESTIKMYSMIR